eukprot:jgi/Orpsp1_1/1185538/evm.model.c7180000094294.1
MGISFNYSESFNHVTELSVENFVNWRTNILYLLCINNLDQYISSPKIKKLKRKDINENIEEYIIDKFDPSLVYDIETTEKDIKNDILVKYIITNSLGEKTKKILESQSKTAFQLWELLNKSYTRSPEHRKIILKNKINSLKYSTEEDIHIFLAILQNMIEELERIDTDIPDSNKVGILNRTLPENLRWINVFQFNNDWNSCCNYVKRIVPDIIFSNLKETSNIEENPPNILNTEMKERKNQKTKLRTIKRRRNGRCYICGKYGHFQKECWNNKRNKNNK